jgi:hypothetical protein
MDMFWKERSWHSTRELSGSKRASVLKVCGVGAGLMESICIPRRLHNQYIVASNLKALVFANR